MYNIFTYNFSKSLLQSPHCSRPSIFPNTFIDKRFSPRYMRDGQAMHFRLKTSFRTIYGALLFLVRPRNTQCVVTNQSINTQSMSSMSWTFVIASFTHRHEHIRSMYMWKTHSIKFTSIYRWKTVIVYEILNRCWWIRWTILKAPRSTRTGHSLWINCNARVHRGSLFVLLLFFF